jgi:hypothetical protein
MPSYSGNLVHQMHIEHSSSKSLGDFVDALNSNDYIIVEEFYKDRADADYYSRGFVALNHRYVGKIKEYEIGDRYASQTGPANGSKNR